MRKQIVKRRKRFKKYTICYRGKLYWKSDWFEKLKIFPLRKAANVTAVHYTGCRSMFNNNDSGSTMQLSLSKTRSNPKQMDVNIPVKWATNTPMAVSDEKTNR